MTIVFCYHIKVLILNLCDFDKFIEDRTYEEYLFSFVIMFDNVDFLLIPILTAI